MGQLLQRFRRDIFGLCWLGMALFLLLALISYHPSDPSFNSLGRLRVVHNYCGYFGSFLADLLLQFFGLAAYLLPLGALRVSLRHFLGSAKQIKLGWTLLSLATMASLLALYAKSLSLFGAQIAAGGLLGVVITHSLVSVFNPIGSALILWCLALILLVFFTEKSLSQTLLWLVNLGALKRSAQALSDSLLSVQKWIENRKLKNHTVADQQIIKDDAFKSLAPLTPPESEVRPGKLEEKIRDLLGGKIALVKTESKLAAKTELSLLPNAAGSSGSPHSADQVGFVETLRAPRQVANWNLPSLDLLDDHTSQRTRYDEREVQRKSEILVDKLSQFSVAGEVVDIKPGPAVTMFEFKPKADVKISKITDLAEDLSLALSSESVRIIAPIPGRDVVGIETSNSKREMVYLKEIISNEKFWDQKIKLPVAMGREANGDCKVVDLRKMPHLLVAGTTGSGKSVFVVSAITGLLFRHSPRSLRLILIDPKQVDLAAFNHIPHLLMPPIREAKKAVSALRWAIREMDKRYRSMSCFGARGLEAFNEIVERMTREQTEEHERCNQELEHQPESKQEQYYFTPQPFIVIVVEEFGDLMAVDKLNVEQAVVRLAQMARACGIHLILAMQSPRKDVVTGLIKTNIPGRISFKVASKMDSRIILDEGGAERLLAQGDMLFLAPGMPKPQRHHGAFLAEEEINKVMRFWAEQGEPSFDLSALRAIEGSGGGFEFTPDAPEDEGAPGDEESLDDMYDLVFEYVLSLKEVSASLLQRRFRLGYPRAARLIELFEREGIVGPANGSKPRLVLRAPQ